MHSSSPSEDHGKKDRVHGGSYKSPHGPVTAHSRPLLPKSKSPSCLSCCGRVSLLMMDTVLRIHDTARVAPARSYLILLLGALAVLQPL